MDFNRGRSAALLMSPVRHEDFNLLVPGDAIWYYEAWSLSVQVEACYAALLTDDQCDYLEFTWEQSHREYLISGKIYTI